jgi:hypothetical protein
MATIVRENPNPPVDTSHIPDSVFENLKRKTLEKIELVKAYKEEKKILEVKKEKEKLEQEAIR